MALWNLFGAKFMCIPILVEFILQAFIAGGGSGGLIGAPIFLLLSTFQISASRMQVLESIAISSWSLKPLIGIISDTLYIGGYNKIPYIILTSLGGILSSLILVTFYPLPPMVFAALLFFIFLPISTSDLLLEARYVEKTRGRADVRPTLQSFIQFCSGVCQLASIAVVGLLLFYHVPLQWLYLSPILPLTTLCVIVFANWIGDTVYQEPRPLSNLCGRFCWFRQYNKPIIILNDDAAAGALDATNSLTYTDYSLIGLDTSKIKENWRVFLLGLLIGMISLCMSTIGLLELSTHYLCMASVFSGLVMIVSFFVLLERRVAKILTFMVLQNMFSISLRAATFFFYTNPIEAYPEGPHFTRQFYITVMGGFGIIISVFGILIYTTFMYNWTYRRMFFITSVLYIVTCVPNVFLFKRMNVGVIPDTAFVLGSEVVQVIVGQLNSIPFAVMMLALCPPHIAATLYAIMAGSNNVGSTFSSFQGAFVLDQLNIKPTGNMTGESRQFDNLYIASIISIAIQVVPLFFINILIPDVKQTDDLLNHEEDESPDVFILSEIEMEYEIDDKSDKQEKRNPLFI